MVFHFWILLAISILCDSIAAQSPCQVTMAAIEGPYYKAGAPIRNSSVLCDYLESSNGTKLIIKGRVIQDDCSTGIQALLDIWSADTFGNYSLTDGDYRCRGKFITDPAGYFQIDTVVPGWYLMDNAFRPAHIHWKISPLDEPEEILTTQLYFDQDPFLAENDPCPGICHSGDPTITVPKEPGLESNTVIVEWNVVLRQRNNSDDE